MDAELPVVTRHTPSHSPPLLPPALLLLDANPVTRPIPLLIPPTLPEIQQASPQLHRAHSYTSSPSPPRLTTVALIEKHSMARVTPHDRILSSVFTGSHDPMACPPLLFPSEKKQTATSGKLASPFSTAMPCHSPMPFNSVSNLDELDQLSDSGHSSVSTMPMRLELANIQSAFDAVSERSVRHTPMQAVSISSTEALTDASSPMSRQSSEETVPMRLVTTPSPPNLDQGIIDPLTVSWFTSNYVSSVYESNGGVGGFAIAFDLVPWRYRHLSEPNGMLRGPRDTILSPWRRVRSAPSLFFCADSDFEAKSVCPKPNRLSEDVSAQIVPRGHTRTKIVPVLTEHSTDESSLLIEVRSESELCLASHVDVFNSVYSVTQSVTRSCHVACVERASSLLDMELQDSGQSFTAEFVQPEAVLSSDSSTEQTKCIYPLPSIHAPSLNDPHVKLHPKSPVATPTLMEFGFKPDNLPLRPNVIEVQPTNREEQKTVSSTLSHSVLPRLSSPSPSYGHLATLPSPVSVITAAGTNVTSAHSDSDTGKIQAPCSASSSESLSWPQLSLHLPVDQSTCVVGIDSVVSSVTAPLSRLPSRYPLSPESESRDLDEVVEPLSESSDFVSPDTNQLVGNCSSSSGSSGIYPAHTTLQMLLSLNSGMDHNPVDNASVLPTVHVSSSNKNHGPDTLTFPPASEQHVFQPILSPTCDAFREIHPQTRYSFPTAVCSAQADLNERPQTNRVRRTSSPNLFKHTSTTAHSGSFHTTALCPSVVGKTTFPVVSTTNSPATTIPASPATRTTTRQRRSTRHMSTIVLNSPSSGKIAGAHYRSSRKFVSTPTAWLGTTDQGNVSVPDSFVGTTPDSFFESANENLTTVSVSRVPNLSSTCAVSTLPSSFQSVNIFSLPSPSGLPMQSTNNQVGPLPSPSLCNDPTNYYPDSASSYPGFSGSSAYTSYSTVYNLPAPVGYTPLSLDETSPPMFSTKTSYESPQGFHSSPVFFSSGSERARQSENRGLFSSETCSLSSEPYQFPLKSPAIPNNSSNFYNSPSLFQPDYRHHSISTQSTESTAMVHSSFTSPNGRTSSTLLDPISCLNTIPMDQTSFLTPMTRPSTLSPTSVQTPQFVEPCLTPCPTTTRSDLTGLPAYMSPVTIVPTTGPVPDGSSLTDWSLQPNSFPSSDCNTSVPAFPGDIGSPTNPPTTQFFLCPQVFLCPQPPLPLPPVLDTPISEYSVVGPNPGPTQIFPGDYDKPQFNTCAYPLNTVADQLQSPPAHSLHPDNMAPAVFGSWPRATDLMTCTAALSSSSSSALAIHSPVLPPSPTLGSHHSHYHHHHPHSVMPT